MSTSLLEILKKTTEWFEQRKIPNPRLDAELIIAHVLKKDRMQLYLEFDKPLYEDDLAPMRELIARRGKREPLQHILGTTEFRYLEIDCSPSALIPRPETEVLVDIALNQLKAQFAKRSDDLANFPSQRLNILEIGVGTGIISLSIAKEFDQILIDKGISVEEASSCFKILGVDISQEAITLSEQNAMKNQIHHVNWLNSNLFEAIPIQKFDLIVSNPPYIPQQEMKTLEPEVRDYDPTLALVGGENGLELSQQLILNSTPFIQSGSQILLELGPGQVDELQKWLELQTFGEFNIAFEKFEDYNHLQRFALITFS